MGQRDKDDPVLTEFVQERLARLLAENRPRRAQPEQARPRDRLETGRTRRPDPGGPPEFLPSDDDLADDDPASEDLVAWADRRPPRRAGSSVDELLGAEAEGADDGTEPPPRRFHRRHLGVVVVLLVLGLLGAGWSVLRARPVAIASTSLAPVTAPATAATASRLSPGVAAGGGATASPARSTTPAPVILVHVLGAVNRPGVVSLPERARVLDAIRAAGGLKADAAPGELNLAQVLADGEQIVIGTRRKPSGQVRDGSSPSSTTSTEAGSGGGGTVDLNRASETELEALPGVGPVTAGKILAFRTEHSRFSRIEELQEVDGIGPKTYAEIAPHVRV